LTVDLRVKRRQDVVLTRSGDEALLVDEQGGNVHVLNASAARLWELCDGAPTVGELSDSFAAGYEVDPAAARADVERMLSTLGELGLLDVARAGA
jgi:pyrroloquinoline quinone biosynthesis protein D